MTAPPSKTTDPAEDSYSIIEESEFFLATVFMAALRLVSSTGLVSNRLFKPLNIDLFSVKATDNSWSIIEESDYFLVASFMAALRLVSSTGFVLNRLFKPLNIDFPSV